MTSEPIQPQAVSEPTIHGDSQAITYRGIRTEIGEILVRNHLRTDQVAINELVRLIELEREDAQVVALAMNAEEKYQVGYTEGVMVGRVQSDNYSFGYKDGSHEMNVEVRALLDEYDQTPDDMAGFEIRIKKAVEFRTKLKELEKEYAK